MVPLRIAVIGCGFWSRFQIPAWHEIEGVTCVAVCDRDKGRSRTIAAQFNIPLCYQEPVKMLQAIRPDVVDIVTGPETHRELVDMASDLGVPVICQKPMAIDFASA